jgi:hypothetical protein
MNKELTRSGNYLQKVIQKPCDQMTTEEINKILKKMEEKRKFILKNRAIAAQ